MSLRFFAEPHLKLGPFVLEGEQAHHLANVMRKQPGDQIILFDGTDQEFTATIQSVSKKKINLEIVDANLVSRELANQIVLAVALPKGDRQKFLIEKLVETGVSKLIPLKTTRAVADAKPKVIERLKKQIIEASKQSERNRLMEIASPQTPKELISHYPDSDTALKLVAHPYESSSIAELPERHSAPQKVIVVVGPEGGFTDAEIELFSDANWHRVNLGPAILRIETAALCAAVLLRQFN